MMDGGLHSIQYLSDLSEALLINETEKHFITSDSPVVFYNYKNAKDKHNHKQTQKNSTTGFRCGGLIIFCPLTENLLFLLYDSVLYDAHLDTLNTIKVKRESDVDTLNKLQLLNCYEEIYYYDDHELDYIKGLHTIVKDDIEERDVIITELQNDGISVTTTDINYKIELSFIKPNRENNKQYRRIKRENKKKYNQPTVFRL
jgi:hypothetical protein